MKKRRIAYIVTLLLVFLVFGALGEPNAMNASGVPNLPLSVDPTGRAEGFSAILYNNPNGLPTSEANAITETSEGFIWLGSYAGLIRYDGHTFERFDSTTGIANVRCLFTDSRDRLWIGTNDSGVFLMEKGELRQWDKAEGMKSSSIRAVVEGSDGLIYVGSTVGIALIDRDMNLSDLRDDRISALTIRELRPGSSGLVYGLTASGDVFAMKNGKITVFLSHEDTVENIISILPDPAEPGALYVGTDSSRIFHGTIEDRFMGSDALDISPLSDTESMEFIDGQIWICSGDGIGNLDENGFHLLENVPMNNSVGHVMTDYEGNLWFTSTRQGVMKIVPNQFADVFDRCGLPAAVVNSTCVLGDRLFIASDSGLTVTENNHKLDSLPLTRAVTASGKTLEAEDLLAYLDGVRIRTVFRDSKNRIWIATWRKHGLLRYDRGELVAFTQEDGLFSDRIRTVSECEDGRILVANTGGVSIIDGDRVTEGYGEADGIAISEILTLTEGFNGEVILGSDGGGIYIAGSGETRNIGKDDGLNSDIILRIKRSPSRNVYWIITSNSLAYMTADYQVHTIRRFPYPNNYDLIENSKGDVWVLASNGIYVVSADELLANGEIEPVFYGIPSGLPYMATANSYSSLTEDGNFYIASSSGVVKVNVEKPFENVNDLKAAVPFVDTDGIRRYPDESGSFVIPADTRKLTVYSFVYNYSPMNPQVSYYLEGFDHTMTTMDRSELGPADYTNLRGGDYRFVMQIKDSMGRGNREVSVQIRKEKNFYEEIWFNVVAGAAAIALISIGVWLYTRKKTLALKKKNHETALLVKEITHAFAKVIDMKDRYTNGHSSRVAKYTALLAKELGYDEETVDKFTQIALLHDIGKIGVPPEVLNKAGKLTDEEFEIIKSHTTKGYNALKQISIMPELATGAQAHHERPDGKGYPNHLKGDEIPRVAQIIAVADCFDAMYSDRPYRKRMNFEKAVSIIQEVSGTQLTADVVDAFMRLVAKGEFRSADDHGGGTTENIDNIHKAQEARENEGKQES
ncbi:MAG: HD domain-containing protein [Clostridia bacterium]|nr:HD domain-containing protein [Clostridia bacterium]